MNQKRKSTVLIIGDIMIDRYISGNVNRISPEAPIPVLKYEKEHSVLGGAGNVAANVVALGGRAILVGVVGEGDENNRLLGYILENNSILTFPNILDIVTVEEAGRQTTVKTRYMSGSHQLLRLDKESISPITDYSKDQIIRIIQSSILEADVVILSDYNKGVLQPDLLEKIIDIARKSYKTIIVDPKRKTFKDYKNSHIITPNVQEVFEATGIRVIDNDTA
jgi:D-beta-D-heptose 7-phosphate kinase/D-beta-D-heptose 1-phosphate adenosyltransferase